MSAELARSLLLVDDDEVFRCRLARAFRDRGWDVREAGDLDSALRTAEEDTPEYVVVDLRLPDGSGLEVVRRLKTLDATTTVVVLTGYGSIATALDALRLGAAHYLTKPAAVDDLVTGFARAAAGPDDVPVASPDPDRRHALAGARRVGAHQPRARRLRGQHLGSRAAPRPAPTIAPAQAGQVSGGPMSPADGACQGRCAVSPGHLPSHMVCSPGDRMFHRLLILLSLVAVLILVPLVAPPPVAASQAPRTLKLRFPRTVIPAGGNVEVCAFLRLPETEAFDLASYQIVQQGFSGTLAAINHFLVYVYTGQRLGEFSAQEKQVIESRGCLDLGPIDRDEPAADRAVARARTIAARCRPAWRSRSSPSRRRRAVRRTASASCSMPTGSTAPPSRGR